MEKANIEVAALEHKKIHAAKLCSMIILRGPQKNALC